MTGLERPAFAFSPRGARVLRLVMVASALVGIAIGVETAIVHLQLDPFADARVYYDAGTRLNAGLPLYTTDATGPVGLYLYPPLLALCFRPLALLPFPAAAAIWGVVLAAAGVGLVQRIGGGRPVRYAAAWLALPILWAFTIGQAEPLITLLLAAGMPASVAFAGHLKLVPWLAAVYWVANRQWRALGRMAVWVVAIGLVQLVLDPTDTLAYLRLTWVRPAFDVNSISPFVVHPALWVLLVAVLAVLALRFGRTRYGWPLAVALAVLAYPRLLVYQLSSLLAVLGGPRRPRESAESRESEHAAPVAGQ